MYYATTAVRAYSYNLITFACDLRTRSKASARVYAKSDSASNMFVYTRVENYDAHNRHLIYSLRSRLLDSDNQITACLNGCFFLYQRQIYVELVAGIAVHVGEGALYIGHGPILNHPPNSSRGLHSHHYTGLIQCTS